MSSWTPPFMISDRALGWSKSLSEVAALIEILEREHDSGRTAETVDAVRSSVFRLYLSMGFHGGDGIYPGSDEIMPADEWLKVLELVSPFSFDVPVSGMEAVEFGEVVEDYAASGIKLYRAAPRGREFGYSWTGSREVADGIAYSRAGSQVWVADHVKTVWEMWSEGTLVEVVGIPSGVRPVQAIDRFSDLKARCGW